MLRITIYADDAWWRLHLAGRPEGDLVAEAEHTWISAPISDQRVEIDMRDVTGVDEVAQYLLQAMQRAGARFVTRSVWMNTLIEEITANRLAKGGANEGSSILALETRKSVFGLPREKNENAIQ